METHNGHTIGTHTQWGRRQLSHGNYNGITYLAPDRALFFQTLKYVRAVNRGGR